jgi:drug/metabolite transporter (DMT)-like permease
MVVAARRTDRTADAMLLICVLIWSGNFSAMGYALERIEPLALTAIRFLLGGLLFAAIVHRVEGSLRIERRDLGAVLLLAVVGVFLNQVSVVYAVREAGPADVAMLIGIAPVFAAGTALALGHERPSYAHWLGIAVSFAGAGLVIHGSGSDLGHASLLGGLLALIAAATWGAYSALVRPLMARYSALRLSAVVLAAGGLMLVVVAAPQLSRQDWSAPEPGHWAAFAYTVTASLALTNVLWFEGIRRIGASRATLFMYLQPFAGAVIALVLLGDAVGAEQWVGGAVVVSGVAIARARVAAATPPPGE